MNKEELVQEISKKSKVTQKEANEVLSALIETVQKTVSKGKKVTLVGFGTFEPRKRAARNGRNPQTGKEIKIPAKTVCGFLPFLAALLRGSKVPKPTRVTFLPLETVF